MADDDVATKAPESDQHAQESGASDVPETERAQSGPTMGDHCTTDRPTPTAAGTPAGEIIDLNGVQSYIAKPAGYPHSPGKLLLLLTGGTGLHSTNNQLQADAFAARGYLVVMPDQFGGDAAPNTASVSPEAAERVAAAENPSWLEKFKMGAAETAKSFLIDMWLARHTPEKVLPILHQALEGAREQFADAVANGDGIYGVGYCFGAKYILLLLGGRADDPVTAGAKPQETDPEAKPAQAAPDLRVGAIAHGTLIEKENIERVKKPVAMACIESDSLFPDDVREQGKAALELNGVEHDIRVFSGVPHGFAVIGDYGEAHIKTSQSEAFEMMAGWLESR